MNDKQVISEAEMIEIARKVARSRSQKWHDVDDIEGYILLQMVNRKPAQRHHAMRIARNAKIDWIRREIGPKGQKREIRNVFDLSTAVGMPTIEEEGVEHLVSNLNESQRKIVAGLAAGMKYQEIADKMNMSRTHVAQQAKDIRKIMAKTLEVNNG